METMKREHFSEKGDKKRRCPHKRTGRAARRFTSEEVAKEIASAFFSAIVQKARERKGILRHSSYTKT